MAKSKKSGKPAVKPALQNHPPIVLPVDDPRNNAKYKKEHPYVTFKGKSKPPVKKVPALPRTKVSKPVTKVKPIPQSGIPKTHPKVTVHTQDYDDDTVSAVEQSLDLDSDSDNFNSDAPFLFHEIAQENYDVDYDNELGGTIDPSVLSTEGVITSETSDVLTPPSNLAVDDITITAQVNSKDGLPTYTATLSFNANDFDEDYEIRLVKKK